MDIHTIQHNNNNTQSTDQLEVGSVTTSIYMCIYTKYIYELRIQMKINYIEWYWIFYVPKHFDVYLQSDYTKPRSLLEFQAEFV